MNRVCTRIPLNFPLFITAPCAKIDICARMMIERGQKPGRFSYQRVKTGEDESPGYWR